MLDIGLWEEGKKTIKRGEQMKFFLKNFFRCCNFTPFMSKIVGELAGGGLALVTCDR